MKLFNISLDDQSPHVKAGLNFESINCCLELIKHYPTIKINLFVPAAFCRLNESNPCFLTEHLDWVKRMNDLPDNFRIGLHGYYHKRESVKYGRSNNDEWQWLNKKEALIVGQHMLGEFKNAGLKYQKTFRAPGWKLNKDSVLALQELGINCFAGSDEYYHKVKDVLKVKWVSYNWDLLDTPSKGNIIAAGHSSLWTKNFFNQERLDTILKVLDKQEYDFRFIEDM